MVLRQASCASYQIPAKFSGSELVEGRLDVSSSSSDVLPCVFEARGQLRAARTTHCFFTISLPFYLKSICFIFAMFNVILMYPLLSNLQLILKSPVGCCIRSQKLVLVQLQILPEQRPLAGRRMKVAAVDSYGRITVLPFFFYPMKLVW